MHHGGTENTEKLFSDRLLKQGVNEKSSYNFLAHQNLEKDYQSERGLVCCGRSSL